MKPASASVAKHDDEGDGEKFAAGKIYSVKLITGDEFDGIVLAYDSEPNLAIFEEGTEVKPLDSKSLRMVKANCITELKYLGEVNDPLRTKNAWVNLDGLIEKEDRAISDVDKIGAVVTEEAKMIFDAITKTLPARWDNTDILVMGEVFVRGPSYSDCVGGTRVVNDRVKNVLQEERRKLQLK